MTFRFDIKLPTLNEYIKAERTNKYIASALKKENTNKVAILAMSQTREAIQGLNDLYIHWVVTDKRTDPDNIYFGVKFILDGLVQAKILKGDGQKHIKNIFNTLEVGEKNEIVVRFTKSF